MEDLSLKVITYSKSVENMKKTPGRLAVVPEGGNDPAAIGGGPLPLMANADGN